MLYSESYKPTFIRSKTELIFQLKLNSDKSQQQIATPGFY